MSARSKSSRRRSDVSDPTEASALDELVVAARVTGEVRRKPPLVELHVDVEAHNRSALPLWLLIARQAGAPIGARGVDALEIERWGSVRVGTFLGTGGFSALRLGPGAHVTLHAVRVRTWREAGSDPPVEVLVTERLEVGGQLAEQLFIEGDPAVHGEHAVEREGVAKVVQLEPNGRQVPVVLTRSRPIPLSQSQAR
jgi:hypothetical protein